MTQRRMLHTLISGLLLFSMVFNLVAPAAYLVAAQETTEEPIIENTAPEVTEEAPADPLPSETPITEPTEETTPEPVIDPTEDTPEEATVEVTEPPLEPTETDTPAEVVPVDSLFEDDFQSGATDGWTLSAGWQLAAEDGNLFLTTTGAGETAAVNGLDWEHLLLAAQVRVEPENTLTLALRSVLESYTLEIDAAGQVDLYRGETLLAVGTPASEAEAIWRKLNVQILGDTITVAVDGVLQFSYADPAPLGSGAVIFGSGPDNTGAVAIDDIVLNKLDAPLVITETPVTEQPTVEVTDTPTEESTPEVTAEPSPVVRPILTADFEGDNAGWLLSEDALIISEGSNNVLSLGTLTPADALYLADFRVETRFKLTEGALNFDFRAQAESYRLQVAVDAVSLNRADVALTSAAAELDADTWYSLSVTAQGGQITVTVDGQPVIEFTDEAPLPNGQISFSASGEVWVDNIVVIDFTPASEASATPLPLGLTEADRDRLQDVLYEIVELYLSGDEAAAFALAEANFVEIDSQQRVSVFVYAEVGQTGASLVPVMQALGGVVDFTGDFRVAAHIPLSAVPAALADPAVAAITLPDRATSTGTLFAPLDAGSGGVVPHSLDHLGVTDWFKAGITGTGVNVGVIDTSFTGVNPAGANYACFSGTVAAGDGSGHGALMVQVLCDVAPGATVRGYVATNSTQLTNQINAARTANNRVIVIALDLGAHIGPGDGTDGNTAYSAASPNTVYDAIRAAREAGILVITSAGNNNDSGYVSWTFAGTVTFQIQAVAGDTVSLSWNDWPASPNGGGTFENFQLAIGGGGTASRAAASADPGVQLSFGSAGTFNVTVTRTGGDSASDYVQLQTTGRITGNNGGLTPNTSSTMGRPGDSLYALSVGAACSSQNSNYPILVNSSRGPLFAAGGGQPPALGSNDRTTVKPDIVSLSHVSVAGITEGEVTTPCGALGDDGFNGTSAAAAHVAGMAALLISNTNTSMDVFNSGTGAANALQNYLQTHAIGLLNSSSGNGFDNTYGAGLAVLGGATYNLNNISKPAAINGLPGTTHYVGGRGLSAANNPVQTGTHENPFVSLSRAIDAAAPGDSIVLFPGEYVSGIEIAKSVGIYSYSALGSGAQSVFRVNNSFQDEAGLFVTANDVIIRGFDFQPSDPDELSAFGENFPRPDAIEFRDVTGGQLLNNTFNGYNTSVPVTVSNSPGVIVRGNQFTNNDGGSLFNAALRIENSESANSANPVVIQNNTFSANITTRIAQDLDLEAIVNVEDSAVDFIGNFFYNNNSEAVVRINNTDNPGPATGGSVGTSMVNFYSNLFLSNREGPVVFARIGRRMRFINNTVVNHRGNTGSFNPHLGLIHRDNPFTGAWFHVSGDVNGNWDVHNNIFYNNNNGAAATLKLIDEGGGSDDTLNSFCVSLGSGTNTGFTNNWVFNSGVFSSAIAAGDCAGAMASGANPINNNLISNPQNGFVTPIPDANSLYPATPNSYRLQTTAAGIDAGNASVPNSTVDFTGINPRLVDLGPDIGAFELTPLQALPITVERQEDVFNQLGDQPGAFAIDLTQGVIGGFEPYTYSVASIPANFSTLVSNPCGGAGARVQGSIMFYCPPQHFYNVGTPFGTADDVVFEFRVTDVFGATATETITVNIAATNDPALNNTAAVTYNYITEISEPFSFRLRPFVRFSNFRFSEAGDPTRGNFAQYPFTYDSNSVTVLNETAQGDNPLLFGADRAASQAYLRTQIAAATPDGLITLTPTLGEVGYLKFTYTVADSSGGQVTNTIRLEVTGILPDRGFHDDSSLNFTYTNGWSPVYSEGNINNTLHTSEVANAKASFEFVAETFTLYMQSDPRGANWNLRIDNQLLNWTVASGESQATLGAIFCATAAPTNGSSISNTNRFPTLYTVSCRNLRDGESHVVEITNLDTRRRLHLDAISLGFDGDPIYPGFHEVNEMGILPYFPGWTVVQDAKASNRVMLTRATTGTVSFSFRGTGIAFGTLNEAIGASYDICITPQGGTEVCNSYDNTVGAPRRGATYGMFRSFFGYDPAGVHNVRLVVKSLPTNGRMTLDSITVFNQTPTAPLAFGTTENDQIGAMIFGNGQDDSWTFDTRNRRASNSSLHTITPRINNAGPFISFEIPADANRVLWYRLPGKKDSTQVRICVDRAQGEAAGNHCQTVNLLTAPNPFVIGEGAYTGGWGTGFGPNNTHTIEIFSLTNAAFNMDKVQVFNTTQPLQPSYYEEFNLDGNNNVYGYFRANNTLGGQDFANIGDRTTTRASGGAVKRTTTANAGVFFQMTGTGFTTYFTRDTSAGNVQICWVSGHTNNIATILGGTCRTYNNSGRAFFQMGRTVAGLSSTPQNYSVAIRNLGGRMDFDALEIHDTLLDELLDVEGFRYETSYINRNADKLFNYYGTGWRTVNAPRSSGGSNDDIGARIGAGFAFRTDNIDTVEILRTINSRFAWVEVCVDGLNCRTFSPSANPLVARMSDSGPHVVSVTTITEGKFAPDAVDTYNSANAVTPGFYEDFYPLLRFDGNWGTVNNRAFSATSAQQTSTNNASMLLHMNGSFLQIGALATQANQMQVCFVAGNVTNVNNVNDNCQTWPATVGTAVDVYNRNLGTAGDYTVRVRNTAASALSVDFVNTVNSTDPLAPGLYQETYTLLTTGRQGAGWAAVAGNQYSGGAAVQTSGAGERILFAFEGTGFNIGTALLSTGGEMQVCYESGPLSNFAGNGSDIDAQCYTYNNNARATNTTTSRSINGLAQGIYSVRVQNVTGTLVFDYAQIFSSSVPTITIPGVYNEDAGVSIDQPYLSLMPANLWRQVSGRTARNYSNSSYMTVVDASGRATNRYAGPIATLRVEVPADPDGAGPQVGTTTVILNTGPTSPRNTDALLICVNHAMTANCSISNAKTSQYHFTTLNNNTASPVVRTITYRALNPGTFSIDDFQVINDRTLSEGLYDNFLMGDGGIIDLDGTWLLPPASGTRSPRAFGGTQIATRATNAAINFDFNGTGFAVLTQLWNRGIDFRVCYVRKADFTTWNASNVTCRNMTSSIPRGVAYSYSHSIFGLQPDIYKARLTINDSSISTRDLLHVDAIAVYGDVTSGSALQPGMYDDADLVNNHSDAVRFAPGVLWTAGTTRQSPPRGAWNQTEHITTFGGTIVQMYLQGNAVAIYQTVSGRSSGYVNACLVIPGSDNELACGNFSQNSRRNTFFTPIIIYGLGVGTHQVILENKDTRPMNIDAVQVIR